MRQGPGSGSSAPEDEADPSPGVVEDDAQAGAGAGEQAADAVAHGGAVVSARAFDGTLAHGKDDDLALLECDRLAARLLARSLLDEKKIAARVVGAAPAQDTGELQGEGDLAVQILVQAVVAADLVTQEERRRFRLAGLPAGGLKDPKRRREAAPLPQRLRPGVGHRGQSRVGALPPILPQPRQRGGA